MNKFLTIFLFVVISVFYGSFLSFSPVHLNQDELGFALNAYSIVQTGNDENGRFMPLYFWHLGVMWATPVIVYLTAIFLEFLPLSEITIRLPSVFMGMVNLFLIYLLSFKIFKKKFLALISVSFLALTPVHFIQSRMLLDNLYPLPFIIGWLLFLYIFMENRKIKWLALGMFLLGFGIHSYHPPKIWMPLYFLATLLILWRGYSKKSILISSIFFILPLLPFIWWLPKYPDTLIDQVRFTGLYNTQLDPFQGLLSLLNSEGILSRLRVYISYFNLKFLFLHGDLTLIHSTRNVGVFLFSFAVLLPLGIYLALRKKDKFFKLILFGFFSAPIPASLVLVQDRASRILVILPFAVLLATYGASHLLAHKFRFFKILAVLLLILIPIQFSFFLKDYFTGYRERSYTWFNYNIPGILEEVIKQDNLQSHSRIYIDNRTWLIQPYWKFYLIKNNRTDLLSKTEYYTDINLNELPKGSLLEYRFDNLALKQQIQGSNFRKIKEITEPDGFVSYFLYKN